MQNRNPTLMFWLMLAPCLALSLAALAYPLYVIRPFRPQGVTELTMALAVLRFRPLLEAMFALAAMATLVWYWLREPRWGRRCGAIAGTFLVCASAGLSRVNVYEQMFHPLDHPSFSPVAESKLDGKEKVIAVTIGSVARAYPIRGMSYHHIVNDTLGGVPIVATY